uniref:GH25 family lysozyme n=1 Tax=Suilimivivens sp. TaxID=2981669 RepID=UPI00307CA785
TGKIEVALNMTSIQKDLKIKFVNKTSGKLIPSIAFEAEVTPPDGKNYVLKDDDKDGIIYEKNIAPGKYKVAIIGPSGLDEYSFSQEAVTITVKDTIEYKKVEVADEIKSEAQVNAAVEDTAVNNTEVESTNTDTVEWVESTKTLIEGTEKSEDSYEKVSRSDITDPAAKTAAGFRLLSKKFEEESGGNNNSETTPAPVQTETPTPTPEPEATETPTEKPQETKSPEVTAAPTEKPQETKSPEATAAPTAVTPTAVPTATPSASASASASASVSPSPSVAPSATPTVTPSATPTPANSARTDTKTDLKNNSGDKLYVKDSNGNFREAKYADYYNNDIKEFYRKNSKTTGEYRYTGWQTIDGATYFFDKNGNKVTGRQVIQGAEYKFNDNGVLDTGSGHMGIDVSKWNGGIDWKAVKNSGVSYVIIRCGYRGSTTGALIEDPKFRSNIQGAQNAGLKVGVYFFTQAVNEVEAVEEASMVLSLIKGYNISYPVFLDVEASNGRGDAISADTRTAVCRAFCQTIQNSGYKAGIYANKTWFTSYMNTPSLTGYKIWLAQYAAAPSYTRTKYDMWQYSSKGKVSGISGNVDMNISYLGY